MPAYAFDTRHDLDAQLTSTGPHGGSLDSATAAQIVKFLNGEFDPKVLVEGPAPLSGTDSTPHVDVYEITNATFDSNNLAALPTATAIVDVNKGHTTINIFDNYNASILLAANAGGNFIDLHKSTGTDTILAGDGNNSVVAGDGQELIYLGSGNSTLVTHDGDNTIYGSATNDPSTGGNDHFKFEGGSNTLYASNGDNTINAVGGDNVIKTGYGDNSINLYDAAYSSSADTDRVTLGAGNDTVDTGMGMGTIHGGSGNDLFVLSEGGAWKVTGDTSHAASGSTDIYQITDSSNISGINTIHGGAATNDFNIFGQSNNITGGSGTNIFNVATPEQQTLTGGSGFNLFEIGASGGYTNDTIHEGSGINDIDINATKGSISIDGSTSPGNSLDFTQFSAGDATIKHSAHADTYTFGSGPAELKVTITNPSDTTIKFS